MPLYDFDCEACGTAFEDTAAPGETAPCPNCGSTDRVRRVWSAPSVGRAPILRGVAARRSDAQRAEKVAARQERIAEAKKKRGT
jgi:putative FmdB family regulatory protein